jgi:PHP family Zn ribbon phosphoesterase
VQAIIAKLGKIPGYVDRFQYASSVWAAQKIRERGGLGIFAHPYWRPGNANYTSYALVDYLIETRVFDALELISGFSWPDLQEVDVNNLQVAKYIEAKSKGIHLPVVGISDSHSCESSDQFGRYYTIVFAPSPELQDLIKAITEEKSVAVETLAGQLPRVYGPFRLVNYAHFILRYVMPAHDEMCFEEGRLMLEYAGGNQAVLEQLKLLKGQVQKYYETVWAKENQ